jgi:predicted metalloprotease with PDZ domain
LQDTTSDDIIFPPQERQSWASWQRFEDYYNEGVLLWLDADTLIRELSHGERSLDDFARSFFGMNDGSLTPLTYTFDDVVSALNGVQPYDWTTFLRERLDAVGPEPPLDGITRGGYKLVYRDTANDLDKSSEAARGVADLTFSIGLTVDRGGYISKVVWDGPAFNAGLSAAAQIVAVDGVAFGPDRLKEAIKTARGTTRPFELTVRDPDNTRVVRIDYHNGLRYPHLERDVTPRAYLDEILTARK